MFAATDACAVIASGSPRTRRSDAVGTADEVAQAAVALCTLDWVTGQVVVGRRRRVVAQPDRPDGLDVIEAP